MIIVTVFRLWNKTLKNKIALTLLCLAVFAASLYGLSGVLLILAAGTISYLIYATEGYSDTYRKFNGVFIDAVVRMKNGL